MSVDFWCEVASPLKNPLKEAFFSYAKKIYETQNKILSSYFPVVMGGDMPSSDYLINMPLKEIPDNLLTMGFGECSNPRFYEKLIENGIYSKSKIVGWFAETMVVDTRRLGNCPLPKSFFDLVNPCYKNEICIIGNPKVPDPLVTLYISKKLGINVARNFVENIAGFGAPVNAIRHIGKSSNSFGSIFIIPLLFAEVCREIKLAEVIVPTEGYFAEPFILFSKPENQNKNYSFINDFINSPAFENAFNSKNFLINSPQNKNKIFPLCNETYFPELEEIYNLLKKKFQTCSK